MTFTGRLSSAGSQTFASSRRSVLGKLFATAVATAAAKRSAQLPLPLPFPLPLVKNQLPLPGSYPLPEFAIGDLVASDWLDEFDEEATDFGEVVGLCYLPECKSSFRDRNCLSTNRWAYYIYWMHSTCGCDSSYPCFDGEPVSVEELRRVAQ